MRYNLPQELTTKLIRLNKLGGTCTITTNLLQLPGIVVTGWVMLEKVGDRSDAAGDSILMRSINMAAVPWNSRCVEAKDKRTSLPGRVELI